PGAAGETRHGSRGPRKHATRRREIVLSPSSLAWPARRQHLQLDVLEAHLHRAAGVDLQREDAAARQHGIVNVHARLAVEERPDAAALGDDLVIVPVVDLDDLLAGLVVRQDAAPALLVELAPPAGADVGLRPAHLAVGQGLAAELHAAVLPVRHQL